MPIVIGITDAWFSETIEFSNWHFSKHSKPFKMLHKPARIL